MARFKQINRLVFQDLGGWGAVRKSFNQYLPNGDMKHASGWEIFDGSGRKRGWYECETMELMKGHGAGRQVFEGVQMTIRATVQYLWLLNEEAEVRKELERMDGRYGKRKKKKKNRNNNDARG